MEIAPQIFGWRKKGGKKESDLKAVNQSQASPDDRGKSSNFCYSTFGFYYFPTHSSYLFLFSLLFRPLCFNLSLFPTVIRCCLIRWRYCCLNSVHGQHMPLLSSETTQSYMSASESAGNTIDLKELHHIKTFSEVFSHLSQESLSALYYSKSMFFQFAVNLSVQVLPALLLKHIGLRIYTWQIYLSLDPWPEMS